MIKTGVLFAALALLLTACATPQERAAQAEAEVVQLMQEYGPACDRLGFARDTDPWRHCVLDLAKRDATLRAANMNNGPYVGPGFGGFWRRRY